MLVGFASPASACSAIAIASSSRRAGVIAMGCGGFIVSDELGAFALARVLMGLGSGGVWIVVTFETLERGRVRSTCA